MEQSITTASPTPQSTNSSLLIISRILSTVFSPLFIPTYGMLLIMTLSGLNILPSSTKIGATLGVFFITCIVPALYIFILMKLGKVADSAISNPRERFVPFIGTVICYIGAVLYIITLHAPLWMVFFFIGAVFVSIFALLITVKWKISAHASAFGGFTALVFWMLWNNMFPMGGLVIFSVVLILLGAICSSRLILGHHTLAQVSAGTALGILIELVLLFCFAVPAMNS